MERIESHFVMSCLPSTPLPRLCKHWCSQSLVMAYHCLLLPKLGGGGVQGRNFSQKATHQVGQYDAPGIYWKLLKRDTVRTGKKTFMPLAFIILHIKRGLITSHALLFQQIAKDKRWNPVLPSKEATMLNCRPKAWRSDVGAAFLCSISHSGWT